MAATGDKPPKARGIGCIQFGAIAFGGILVVGFLIGLLSPSPGTRPTSPNQTPTQAAAPASPTVTANAASNWSYSEQKDEMRGTTTRYAQLQSSNELDFGFPYGTSNGTLILRKRPKDGLNVMLTITGQFICNEYEGDEIAVKFDNSQIEHYRCNEAADGTTGVLFIESGDKFVRKLKKSKSLIVEAQFYQHGNQQLQFDTAGLDWP